MKWLKYVLRTKNLKTNLGRMDRKSTFRALATRAKNKAEHAVQSYAAGKG